MIMVYNKYGIIINGVSISEPVFIFTEGRNISKFNKKDSSFFSTSSIACLYSISNSGSGHFLTLYGRISFLISSKDLA